jgi:pseudouridine-5'-phosphate glycosidase
VADVMEVANFNVPTVGAQVKLILMINVCRESVTFIGIDLLIYKQKGLF